MSYSPRFPAAIDVQPLPYPLVQQPMTLAPNRDAYGALWTATEWDEDDLYAWLPVPRTRYVLGAAIIGAAVMAFTGKDDPKSMIVGAAAGVVGIVALSGLTTRD